MQLSSRGPCLCSRWREMQRFCAFALRIKKKRINQKEHVVLKGDIRATGSRLTLHNGCSAASPSYFSRMLSAVGRPGSPWAKPRLESDQCNFCLRYRTRKFRSLIFRFSWKKSELQKSSCLQLLRFCHPSLVRARRLLKGNSVSLLLRPSGDFRSWFVNDG